jgi:hypothetical protein
MCALSVMLVSSNIEDWTIKGIGNGDDELTNVYSQDIAKWLFVLFLFPRRSLSGFPIVCQIRYFVTTSYSGKNCQVYVLHRLYGTLRIEFVCFTIPIQIGMKIWPENIFPVNRLLKWWRYYSNNNVAFLMIGCGTTWRTQNKPRTFKFQLP